MVAEGGNEAAEVCDACMCVHSNIGGDVTAVISGCAVMPKTYVASTVPRASLFPPALVYFYPMSLLPQCYCCCR